MPITASVYVKGVQQRDGRYPIVETHTDSVEGPLRYEYRAVSDANAPSIMTARVGQINEMLAELEDSDATDARNLRKGYPVLEFIVVQHGSAAIVAHASGAAQSIAPAP